MTNSKTIDDNFETHILNFNVDQNDLQKNKYEFLGVAKGKDGYKELHVFRKDKQYNYFKFHPANNQSLEGYEFIIRTDYLAESIVKE